MARVFIPDENRNITEAQQISEYLAPHGIIYEQWDVDGRIGPEATNEEILEAYSPEQKKVSGAKLAIYVSVRV